MPDPTKCRKDSIRFVDTGAMEKRREATGAQCRPFLEGQDIPVKSVHTAEQKYCFCCWLFQTT